MKTWHYNYIIAVGQKPGFCISKFSSRPRLYNAFALIHIDLKTIENCLLNPTTVF